MVARGPKRIVYAYDELQNLGSYSMTPPAELFGVRNDGQPNVPDLETAEGTPRRDIVLPVCYRNTPWALTTAHAVGFGIYRRQGLVQFFEDPHLLEEVGYRIRSGSLEAGSNVELESTAELIPGRRHYEEAQLIENDLHRVCVLRRDGDRVAGTSLQHAPQLCGITPATAPTRAPGWCRPATGTSTEQRGAAGPAIGARSSKSPPVARSLHCIAFARKPTAATALTPGPGWCRPRTGTSTGQLAPAGTITMTVLTALVGRCSKSPPAARSPRSTAFARKPTAATALTPGPGWYRPGWEFLRNNGLRRGLRRWHGLLSGLRAPCFSCPLVWK